MLAFVGLLAGEVGPHPFFDGAIGGPSIYQFQQTYDSSFPFFWLVLVAGIANVEIGSIFKNWTSISDTFGKEGGKAKLKDNAVPGNLGFDPLGIIIVIIMIVVIIIALLLLLSLLLFLLLLFLLLPLSSS